MPMETVPPKTFSVLLIVLSMEILIPASFSQSLLPAGLQIPGLLPGDGAQIQQCWSSLSGVPGCIMDIVTSLATFRIGTLSPACCKAVHAVADNCWPKMFPWSPFFPQILNNFCAAPAPTVYLGLLPGLDEQLAPTPGADIGE